MSLEIIIGNHQLATPIPESWLTVLEELANPAAGLALSHAADPDCPLGHLATLEVALVDDETSARVHLDFMGLPDAADVITFHHGEIVIGTEVAARQAAEFNEPLSRELLRYLVHGLLHLAGHADADPADRKIMESAQEAIVTELWTEPVQFRFEGSSASKEP